MFKKYMEKKEKLMTSVYCPNKFVKLFEQSFVEFM